MSSSTEVTKPVDGDDVEASEAEALKEIQSDLDNVGADASEEAVAAWVDKVRVLCRKAPYRNKLRRQEQIWANLCKMMENRSVETLIIVVSAFGNLVVDDDTDFTACISSCKSGFLAALTKRGFESIGKKEESKLQYVISIALTNFSMQLVEGGEYEEQVGTEKLIKDIVALVMDEKNSPVSLAISLALKGENALVKKSALALTGNFAKLSLGHKAIFASTEFSTLIEMIVGMISSDQSESQQSSAVNAFTSLFATFPPIPEEMQILVTTGAMCKLGQLLKSEFLNGNEKVVVSEKVRSEAISLFKGLLKRNDELDSEAAADKDVAGRMDMVTKCGVRDIVLGVFAKRVDSKEAIKKSASTPPSDLLISMAELLMTLATPLNTESDFLNGLLDSDADEILIRNAVVCTVSIDEMLKETMKRRARDPKADIDRNFVMAFARLRKDCLYTLSQLATCEERCIRIVSRKPSNQELFDGKDMVVPLATHIIASMANFDNEATSIASNLLRNVFISEESRTLALEQIDKERLGSALIDLCSSRNQNTASIAAGITRLLCSSRNADAISKTFPDTTMAKALALDLTKIHPTVRVELARALSYCVQTMASKGDDSSPLKKLLLTVEVLSLVAFLLQSKHGVLINEALEAFKQCPSHLLETAAPQVKIYLSKGEEDEDDDEEETELTEEDHAAIEKALEQLDDLGITEEDADLSKLDDSITPGMLVEQEKEKEKEKEKGEEDEEKEDVVIIDLQRRLSSFAKSKITLLGENDDKDAIAALAQSVLDKFKSDS